MNFDKMLFSSLLLITLCAMCNAKVVSPTDSINSNIEQTDKPTNISTSTAPSVDKNGPVAFPNFLSLPNDLSARNGLGQALIVGGAVVVSIILLGAITMFFTPIFGLKLCHIMGGCDITSNNVQTHSLQQPNPIYNDVYGAYIPSAAYGNYQKRSLEYVAPILKTLITAYEKYGQQQSSKKNE